MVTSELLDFLRAQLASGMSYDEVERLLVEEGGWDKADVDEGLAEIGAVRPALTLPTPPPHQVVAEEPTKEEVVVNETPASAVTATEPAPEEAVATPPEQEEPKVPSVSRDVTAPPVENEEEDFLGIFADHQEPSAVEAVPEVAPLTATEVAPPAVAVAPLPVEVTPEVAPIQAPSVAVPPPQVVSPQAAAIPLVAPEPVAPEPVVVAPVPTVAPQEVVAPAPVAPIAPITTPPIATPTPDAGAEMKTQVFKFDLSKLKANTDSAAAAPAPTVAPEQAVSAAPVTPEAKVDAVTPATDKQVQTRSVAELWLSQGKAKEEPAKDDEKEKSIRASLSTKRTMTSDILLRGKGAAIQGLPVIAPPTEANPMPSYSSKPIELAKPVEQKPVKAKPIPTPAEILARKNKLKKTFKIVAGLALGVLLVAGGAVAYVVTRGPDVNTILATSFNQFMAASSFSYSGGAMSDVVLTTTCAGVTRNGSVKFTLGYAGQLNNEKNGFGSGSHYIKWSGGLQSGNFAWGSEIETDLRLTGSNLYFHILSLPSVTDIDPDLFKTYWIKVDIAEIAKELALDTVAPTDEYSAIAGGDTTSFNAIMKKRMPFVGAEQIGVEPINNVSATHFRLKTDSEKTYALALDLYTKYTGKTLALTPEEKLGLQQTFEKLTFEVWIDEKTNTLLQFKVSGNLDNNVLGMHVAGPVALSFTFVGYGSPVGVSEPPLFLSLDELHARMEDYKKIKDLRAKDAVLINGLGEIQHALLDYQTLKKRFPTTLAELRVNSILSTTTMSDDSLKSYIYAPYVVGGNFAKTNKCNVKSKTCTSYHIGVSLLDASDPALSTDADQTSEIHGDDSAGCSAEADMQCYDIVFTPVVASSTPATASSTTPALATTTPKAK